MSMYSASLHPSKSCFVAGGENFKLYKFDFEDGKELGTFWVFLCYFVCMLAHILSVYVHVCVFLPVCLCVCMHAHFVHWDTMVYQIKVGLMFGVH